MDKWRGWALPALPLGTDELSVARGKVADNLDAIADQLDQLAADHAHMSCEHIDEELELGAVNIRRFASEVRPNG